MDTSLIRIIQACLFFLSMFLFGYWLQRMGKPYNGLIFNLHKLIGLGLGVFLIITVVNAQHAADFGVAQIAAVVITVLLFLCTVIAGGLVSINRPIPVAISWAHKVLPYITLVSTVVTLYIL